MKRLILANADEIRDYDRYEFDNGYYAEIKYDEIEDKYRWTLFDKNHRIMNGGIANNYDRAIKMCKEEIKRSGGEYVPSDESKWFGRDGSWDYPLGKGAVSCLITEFEPNKSYKWEVYEKDEEMSYKVGKGKCNSFLECARKINSLISRDVTLQDTIQMNR